MRCLYCGKQLALLRRLTGSGEFCSDAHKQSYHEEYNRLALTRLIAAQSKPDDARSKLSPSTIQLAMGDGQGPKGGNGNGGRAGGRWHDAKEATASRMIPKPAEVEAPLTASFITSKLLAAAPSPAAALPDLTVPNQPLEPVPAHWTPDLAPGIGGREEPPQATHVPVYARTSPAELPPPAPHAVADSSVVPSPATHLEVPALPLPKLPAGLSLRGPLPLDPVQFAPRFDAQPERVTAFQPLRFALMLFGAPDFPALEPHPDGPISGGKPRAIHPRRQSPASPEAAPPESEPGMRTSMEALRAAAAPAGFYASPGGHGHGPTPPSSMEGRRQEPAQAKLAGLAAALAQESKRGSQDTDPLAGEPEPSFAFEPKPAHRTLAERLAAGGLPTAPKISAAVSAGEKPSPQLPTFPAASKRPATLAIPSILESSLETSPSLPSEREQTLWDRLRRYIKG